MDDELWPARNVAEFAYCPRLFYLMEVEGLHLASGDTEKGISVHLRVDKPSAETSGGEAPSTKRSLVLSSTRLRLTATLDLTELDGERAIPIEYRKGRPKHVALPFDDDPGEGATPRVSNAEPWPTDRVQLALQALLLRESGYAVSHGVLYYAAEKRRITVEITDDLVSEALQVLSDAIAATAGPRPPPLLNDPRCEGCSMQPICLPDEINYERSEQETRSKPRSLWPPNDAGTLLVAQQRGAVVGIRGESIRVKDAEGRLQAELPLAGVDSLALLGGVQISTQAVHALATKGIPLAYLSAAGRMVAFIDPLDSVSAKVRRAQVLTIEDPGRRLEFVRALIAAKIRNQRTLLLRNCHPLPNSERDYLVELADRASAAPSIDSARGLEGAAAAFYFGRFHRMAKGELAEHFLANGRQRRPPPDPLNCVLSFAYSMLVHECVAALRQARLEPSIGVFHSSRPGRPALALDLMEPFRALIADSVAIGSCNRGELRAGHFLRTAAGCALTDAGRRAFFQAWSRRLDVEVTHPVFGYKMSYRRMVVLHARMVAAWMYGELPALSFLVTR